MIATKRVRAFLKREKKSQAWLARELGVTPAHVSQILSGDRRPSLNLATRIEQVTGVEATAFAEAA